MIHNARSNLCHNIREIAKYEPNWAEIDFCGSAENFLE